MANIRPRPLAVRGSPFAPKSWRVRASRARQLLRALRITFQQLDHTQLVSCQQGSRRLIASHQMPNPLRIGRTDLPFFCQRRPHTNKRPTDDNKSIEWIFN